VNVCSLEKTDVIDWWDAFLTSDRANATRTGLLRDDRMFLFAQFEKGVPADTGSTRGIVDLTSTNTGDVKRIIFPVITTAASNEQFADAETAFTTGAYSNLRKLGDQHLIPLSFERIAAYADRGNILNEPYYDGLWSCIPSDGLDSGDTIEFGPRGVRGYSAFAVWEVKK
jgi:hypothetical protein